VEAGTIGRWIEAGREGGGLTDGQHLQAEGKAKYVILYTDENGRRRKKAGATDKAVAQRIAAKLENDVALRKQGLIDPGRGEVAAHERKPIEDHLEGFRAALRDKGNTDKHVDLFVAPRPPGGLSLAGAGRPERTGRDRVQGRWRPSAPRGLSPRDGQPPPRRHPGIQPWLWKGGRLRDDPLVGVTGSTRRRTAGTTADPRSGRPASLIQAAERGPSYRRMTGPARALCYRLACPRGCVTRRSGA
jgi:hypothetical protein